MTGYHQVPRQTSFFQLNSELDPWAVKAANGVNYGWNSTHKAPLSPPSLFDEHDDYTPPHTPPASPPLSAIKKNLIHAQQFISTTSHVDPWTVVNKDMTDMTPALQEEDLSPQNLYKTELCRSFMETNTCRYGVKCQFAHGRHELRAVMRHPKYKTEICKTFHTLGTCPYGIRCRFIHTRAIDIPSDSSSQSSNDSNNSSPSYTPPASPTLRSSPPQVLSWSTTWSYGERPVPPSPEDSTVPDIMDVDQPTSRRLPIFRNIC